MGSPFFTTWREGATYTVTLIRTSKRMVRPADAETGFAMANKLLGPHADRKGWKLLIDLRGAPSVQLDPLVEAAMTRIRRGIYAGFERITYLVGDERRRHQVERLTRGDDDYRVFDNELHARAYLSARVACCASPD